MKLYDDLILKLDRFLLSGNYSNIRLAQESWPSVTDREMILRSDMAYELGTERLYGIGSLLVTDSRELVPDDRIVLIGPDLNEIRENTHYARVAVVRIDDATITEGQSLYSAIRGLEFTRYHFYPKGFMLRISATQKKESVRVGKAELKDGLSIEKVGNLMIDAFKKNKMVQAVKLYYITDPSFDYDTLLKMTQEAEAITKTIDHISQNLIMDCKACNLQEICDEVEGLKELHFKAKTEREG